MAHTISITEQIAQAIKTLAEHMVDVGPVLTAISANSMESWLIIDSCLVPEEGVWHADDGNAEITVGCDSAEEAAQEYVDGGTWGDDDSGTQWISVSVWRSGIDEDGEIVRVDEDTHKITLEASEPECLDGGDHDWQSPHSIVGGCKENPGVWGSGGGVAINEVCIRCGCGKTTDTWAQDPSDGQQGLTSVSYQPGKYASEIEEAEAEEEE